MKIQIEKTDTTYTSESGVIITSHREVVDAFPWLLYGVGMDLGNVNVEIEQMSLLASKNSIILSDVESTVNDIFGTEQHFFLTTMTDERMLERFIVCDGTERMAMLGMEKPGEIGKIISIKEKQRDDIYEIIQETILIDVSITRYNECKQCIADKLENPEYVKSMDIATYQSYMRTLWDILSTLEILHRESKHLHKNRPVVDSLELVETIDSKKSIRDDLNHALIASCNLISNAIVTATIESDFSLSLYFNGKRVETLSEMESQRDRMSILVAFFMALSTLSKSKFYLCDLDLSILDLEHRSLVRQEMVSRMNYLILYTPYEYVPGLDDIQLQRL